METPDIDGSTQYGPTFVSLNLLDENKTLNWSQKLMSRTLYFPWPPPLDQTLLVSFSIFILNHLLVMYAVVFKSSVIALKNFAFRIKTNPIYAVYLSVN